VKRILYLAYHFPPVGGAGVQRNAKFVRYLPELGYAPVVVTGTGGSAGRWTPTDETLETDVPDGVEVHRLAGPEPAESGGWRGRADRWLARRTPWSRWWIEQATARGRELAADVDVVYAAMAPYETAEIAARIARASGKPWVADLQDPWALDEMMVYPSSLHRRLDVARMRAVLAQADAIVMNTPESAARLRARLPELAGKLVFSIPNGFDAADFAGPAHERDDGRFRIVHTGYLHTELGRQNRRAGRVARMLGGTNGSVDIFTRSHVYLLAALDRLLEAEPALASRVELHLAGVLTATDRDYAQHPAVRLRGYLPHAESVALIRSADLLFLPMHNLPPGERMSIVPGKTYEYLASGRPILAAVPDGDARDLLEEAGSARVCRPDDVDAMAEIVASELERARARVPRRAPDAALLARYERRGLSEQLAEVFDGVLAVPARPRRRLEKLDVSAPRTDGGVGAAI
jgi:glycosyltransferase involved in cell wall biosynthesis